MSKRSLIFGSSLLLGLMMLIPQGIAQQKTVKACQEEWRANKSTNQANGVTEKAYVTQCRAGGTPVPSSAAPDTPTAPAPATAPPRVRTKTGEGQKTAKACREEWQANRAGNQASGVTERAYVAQCRAGGSPTAGPATSTAPAPTAAAPPVRPTQTSTEQKTIKACREEWQANKSANQTNGVTERAYIAECRTGTAPTQPTATPATPPAPESIPTAAPAAPAPTTPTAAGPPIRPAAPVPTTTARPAPATPGTTAAALEFSTEAQAKARCASDTVVWVTLKSRVYHFAGTRYYGTTKNGAYMCEADTTAAGMHAAKNETHP
jgi:hypothetical protein